MAANEHPGLAASAREIMRALAPYARNVRSLATTWLDTDLYGTVSEEMDEIRALCGAVPQLAVRCTELLVSHAELVHALWLSGDGGGAAASPEVAARLQEHLACIEGLARRCLHLTAASAPPALHD